MYLGSPREKVNAYSPVLILKKKNTERFIPIIGFFTVIEMLSKKKDFNRISLVDYPKKVEILSSLSLAITLLEGSKPSYFSLKMKKKNEHDPITQLLLLSTVSERRKKNSV